MNAPHNNSFNASANRAIFMRETCFNSTSRRAALIRALDRFFYRGLYKMASVKLSVALAVLALVLLGGIQGVAQKQRCQQPEALREVYTLKERPKLGVDFNSAAVFKLASRKSTYRVGELITIDMAMLNKSNVPLFLHHLSGPLIQFRAQDEKMKEISFRVYFPYLEGIVPKSYQLFEPDNVALQTFYLLGGCNVEGMGEFSKAQKQLNDEIPPGEHEKYNKPMFERNLFVSWGDGCLDVAQPGTYTITAEIVNEYVIASPCEPKAKTAVGLIRSSPLTITIIQ